MVIRWGTWILFLANMHYDLSHLSITKCIECKIDLLCQLILVIGIHGNTGSDGFTGFQGPSGSKGATGVEGSNGNIQIMVKTHMYIYSRMGLIGIGLYRM